MIPNDDLARFADRLQSLIEGFEAARAEMQALKAEIRAAGYDPSALARVVELRRDEKVKAREQERLVAVTLYADRLGVRFLVPGDEGGQ